MYVRRSFSTCSRCVPEMAPELNAARALRGALSSVIEPMYSPITDWTWSGTELAGSVRMCNLRASPMLPRADETEPDEMAEVRDWTDPLVSLVGQPPFHCIQRVINVVPWRS